MEPDSEHSPPSPAGAPPGPERPRRRGDPEGSAFSPFSTALYGAALVLLLIQGWGTLVTGDPVAWLARPGDSAERMSNRDILLAESAEASSGMPEAAPLLAGGSDEAIEAPAPDRVAGLRARMRGFHAGGREDAVDYAIAVHEEVLERLEELEAAGAGDPAATDRVRAALSILASEAGDPALARELAEGISDGGAFAASVASAYAPRLEAAGGEAAAAAARDEDAGALHVAALAEAGLEEWMLARPTIRLLARAAGESAGADPAAVAGELRTRGESLNLRLETLRALQIGVVVLGLGLLLGAAWRSRGRDPGGEALAPPWRLADGIGVLIRGEFWGRLYFFLLLAGAARLPAPLAGALHDWGGLLSALPLLWLTHRHLLSPRSGRARPRDPLGLAPRAATLPMLLGVALAALAVDLSLSEALGWASWSLGVEGHWAEGFDEILAFGGAGRALVTAASYLVWAPLFEELAFRGLLYFSLRRRLAPLPAALLSATAFGLVHFYSLPGFLVTFWSGFVWALAFERARSLWPCVLAHALYNASFVAWMVLIYR